MDANADPAADAMIQLRHERIPGDLGRIIAQHGMLYARECGFDVSFEAYVAATLVDFAQAFSPDTDRLWIAERAGQLAGSVGIVGRSEREAQLHWLLVHPDCRGMGLGRTLVQEALDFSRDCGYAPVFLWTVSTLTHAARLYTALGFQLIEETTRSLWGTIVTEVRYELPL